jgi:membrane protein implicated in regulation of membrane protease activity
MEKILIYSIIGSVVLVLLLIGLIFWFIKRRKKKKQIPQEILDEFNELERRFKEHNGQVSHQEILWEFYKERHMNKLPEVKPEIKPEVNIQPKKLDLSKLFKKKDG